MTAGDNAAEGDFRVCFADASETAKDEIFIYRTEWLDANSDIRACVLVPMSRAQVAEDDKIIIEAYADSTTNCQMDANTDIRIPITSTNKKTGVISPKLLTRKDFGTTNATLTGSTWVKIGSKTVGAQEIINLGNPIPENSKIYVTLKTVA